MSISRASTLKKILEPKCTRMDKLVIEEYYHMTTMDENVNYMKITSLSPIFESNSKVH
jgi:hypothetical protein